MAVIIAFKYYNRPKSKCFIFKMCGNVDFLSIDRFKIHVESQKQHLNLHEQEYNAVYI